MSRVSKYLRQKCSFEEAQRDAQGNVLLNRYGEPMYKEPVDIKCRREITVQDVQTSTGAILKSSTRFFTDNAHTIRVADKLDGKQILKVLEYTNQFGSTEGFESYV